MDDQDSKYKHIEDEAQRERVEKAVAKNVAVRAAEKLNSKDSKWTLLQEIFQEICAAHVIENPTGKLPSPRLLLEELKIEVNERYRENEETRSLLMNSIPSDRAVRDLWYKKEGWDEAVWAKVRGNGLFSKERRAQMVNALFVRGMTKSDNAAKIWLTLSGDYSEKDNAASRDKTIEAFREINEILHKKSN